MLSPLTNGKTRQIPVRVQQRRRPANQTLLSQPLSRRDLDRLGIESAYHRNHHQTNVSNNFDGSFCIGDCSWAASQMRQWGISYRYDWGYWPSPFRMGGL